MANNYSQYYKDSEKIKKMNQQKYKEELMKEAKQLEKLIRNN